MPAREAGRVTQILKNPAYAGAYVYGRRRPDPLRRQPGSDRIGTVAVAPEDWSICLKDPKGAGIIHMPAPFSFQVELHGSASDITSPFVLPK